MKKIILTVSVIVVCTLTSCQKEYRCVCTNSNTGEKSYGDKFKTNAATKKTWEEDCKHTGELSGGSLKDCHLEE